MMPGKGSEAGLKVLLVDGYNLIHSHPSLSRAVRRSLEEAREELLHLIAPICSPLFYEAVVVVFDAPSAPLPTGFGAGGNLQVVYTGGGQSADAFIRKAALALSGRAQVEIVSGDRAVSQMADTLGVGRLSGEQFWKRLEEARRMLREELERRQPPSRSPLEERIPEEVRRALDRIRKGEYF